MSGSLQPELMSMQKLFADSLFVIPSYQRAYAWEGKQWEDLWEDIREGMRTKTTHFLGTVVLMAEEEGRSDSRGRTHSVYHVVDGQQRMTTLCLLLLALHLLIREEDENIAQGLWCDFVKHEERMAKLRLGGLNADYFEGLMNAVEGGATLPDDARSTNMRLREAVGRFRHLIHAWQQRKGGGADLPRLASYIRNNLHVLRFVTDSQPLAIKMFQTVNDRGKDLSLLDKTKSFLMFYVTRYRDGDIEVFESVERAFSQVFDNYDAVRDLASSYNVQYIVNPRFRFNEDEFLRYAYHYGSADLSSRFALNGQYYEYDITPERVFDGFVKDACHALRDQPDELREFVLSWCRDLVAVSNALVVLLKKIAESDAHKRLFQFQGPTASVYPLLVAAQAEQILDDELLQAISVLDLRVYQVRGTDPKADLYRTAVSQIKNGKRSEILNAIARYTRTFGNDHVLASILRGNVYKQSYTKYVLWRFAADQHAQDELDYSLYADCQIEHVLPQEPTTFDPRGVGFESDQDYESMKHSLGNLIVLEKSLNERARNLPPKRKAEIYGKSKVKANRFLGAQVGEDGFKKSDLEDRTEIIIKYFQKQWPC